MQFFTWRSAILKSKLPATCKHVLMVISTYMDDHGGGAFPSIETIASDASLSKRSVIAQIQYAQEVGFVRVTKHGFGGQKWARNEYHIAFPEKKGGEPAAPPSAELSTEVVNDVHHLEEKGSAPDSPPLAKVVQMAQEGGASDDIKVVNQVHSISPMNSPDTSPDLKPQQQACARGQKHEAQIVPRQTSEPFAMYLDWEPKPDRFRDMLLRAGVPPASPWLDCWTEALPEFLLFWLARPDECRQTQWEGKFLRQVQYNMRQAESRPAVTPMTAEWAPSESAWELLVDHYVDLDFAERQLPEFRLYWSDAGAAHSSWNTKFIAWVRQRWGSRSPSASEAFSYGCAAATS